MVRKREVIVIYGAVLQFLLHACIAGPLEVQIYYETLCPYCQNFFTQQFHPNYEKFGYSVKWTLIPYGNAKTVRDSQGNVINITCQHKELECRGNAIQACALQKLPDYYSQIRFCSCFMVNKGDCNAFQQCSQTYGVDYNLLNKCTENGEGLWYLAYYGDLHNQVQPKIAGVPKVLLNGRQLTQQEESALYENFCKFICDNITEQKPQICYSLPSSTTAPPPKK